MLISNSAPVEQLQWKSYDPHSKADRKSCARHPLPSSTPLQQRRRLPPRSTKPRAHEPAQPSVRSLCRPRQSRLEKVLLRRCESEDETGESRQDLLATASNRKGLHKHQLECLENQARVALPEQQGPRRLRTLASRVSPVLRPAHGAIRLLRDTRTGELSRPLAAVQFVAEAAIGFCLDGPRPQPTLPSPYAV